MPLAFGRVTIQGTSLPPRVGSPAHPMEAELGESIRFIGYDLAPEGAVEPGAELVFDLYWRATANVSSDYTVFVHLLGAFNPATGGPVWAQHDGRPLDGQYPTNHWVPGSTIRDRHIVAVPPNTPPGEYDVEVGLYALASGERLIVFHPDGTKDTRVLLMPVHVVR
jgi:hypothetical protein